MKEAFDRDPFSWSFNILRNLGVWHIETDSAIKRYLSWLFMFGSFLCGLTNSSLGFVDLYLSRNDIKKTAYNLCTTTIISGIFVKNTHLMLMSSRLDKLRFKLFKDGCALKYQADKEIKDSYLEFLFFLRKIFYWAASVLLTAWFLCSLSSMKWGPRELPFPVYTPVDIEDNSQFIIGWFYHVVGSMHVITQVIHADLGMFSILFQIIAHYEVLAKKILTINEMYEDGNKEINKPLIGRRTQQILRDCVRRHLILKEYTQELEFCYNKPMMVHLVAVFLLSVGNGLELIVVSMNFSMKLSYQLGYTLIVIGDVFMICHFADLLKSRSEDVAASLYNVSWYDMSCDVRKELLLVLTGTQKIDQLTAGKMIRLDLSTFQGFLKNIYSWLALCGQLLTKT